jgi:hypothetical protein
VHDTRAAGDVSNGLLKATAKTLRALRPLSICNSEWRAAPTPAIRQTRVAGAGSPAGPFRESGRRAGKGAKRAKLLGRGRVGSQALEIKIANVAKLRSPRPIRMLFWLRPGKDAKGAKRAPPSFGNVPITCRRGGSREQGSEGARDRGIEKWRMGVPFCASGRNVS